MNILMKLLLTMENRIINNSADKARIESLFKAFSVLPLNCFDEFLKITIYDVPLYHFPFYHLALGYREARSKPTV
jgi:hypothetical protein